MIRFQRAVTRNQVLVPAAVVLLALGLLYALRSGDERDLLPTDESSWVYFKCRDCQAEFHLDGREIEDAVRSGELRTARQGAGPGVECKQCGSRNTVQLPPGGDGRAQSARENP